MKGLLRVALVNLPLVTKVSLNPAERTFYDNYWNRLSLLLGRDLKAVRFSTSTSGDKSQPAYDIFELPLWIAALTPFLKPVASEIVIVDLFDLSAPNIDMTEVDSRIRSVRANLFLMSPMLLNSDVALVIANTIKLIHGKDAKVLIGGPFATYQDGYLLENNSVDAVFRGRADKSLADICMALIASDPMNGFPDLTWRHNGTICRNASTSLAKSMIEYDYTAISTSYAGRVPWARLYCSEGCPWNCAYCADVIWNRSKPRYRDPKRVLADAELIANRFDVDTFYIGDETFTYDRRFVCDFSDGMRSLGLQWFCQTRVDCVDPSILNVMRRGNCRMVKFGAESANQSILNMIRKNIKIEQIEAACCLVKDAGIAAFTYWLVGLPGESCETARMSIRYVERLLELGLCDLLEWFICVPYPGTDLHLNPSRYGITIANRPWPEWREDSPSVLSTSEASADDIYALWTEGLGRFAPLLA